MSSGIRSKLRDEELVLPMIGGDYTALDGGGVSMAGAAAPMVGVKVGGFLVDHGRQTGQAIKPCDPSLSNL